MPTIQSKQLNLYYFPVLLDDRFASNLRSSHRSPGFATQAGSQGPREDCAAVD